MSGRVYLDTSALVKRYIQEAGSERVHGVVCSESMLLVTSRVLLVELHATLARKRR